MGRWTSKHPRSLSCQVSSWLRKKKNFIQILWDQDPFLLFLVFFFFFYKYFQLDLHELKGCLTPRFHSRETNEKEPPWLGPDQIEQSCLQLFSHFSLWAFPSFCSFNTSSPPSEPIKKRKQNPTKHKNKTQTGKAKNSKNQAKTQPNPQRQIKVIN